MSRSLALLTPKELGKIKLIICAQIIVNFFDLLGIVLIGALSALSIQGIQSKPAGNRVSKVLEMLRLNEFNFQTQVLVLGLMATVVFILKTIFSGLLTRKVFLFLSHKSAGISSTLVSKFLSLNLLEIQKRTSQEILYIMTDGVKNLLLGIVATSISIIVDFTMLVIVFISLLLIDPILAVSVMLLFMVMFFILNILLRKRSQAIGKKISELSIKTNEKTLEVIQSYREALVRNRREFYSDEIKSLKFEFAKTAAELNFQPFISKYIIESTAIIGAFLASSYAFLMKDAIHAVSILVIFLAASARIAPSVLRIQQGLLVIQSSTGSAETTFKLLEDLENCSPLDSSSENFNFSYYGFNPIIEISNLDFNYDSETLFNVNIKDLNIKNGETIAIVGPSGAGKSTFVDLLLGILVPRHGSILISGFRPNVAINKWAGAIAYVPQDIVIFSGTVRNNVVLGFPLYLGADEPVWTALKKAQLEEFIRSLPNGLDTEIGERGAKLSGGQRQRLGIARALFTNPKLLVLDEATSALDNTTELEVSNSLGDLNGEVTLIIVAHRLSTVRKADRVLYFDKGKIIAEGTFEEVRKLVPDFDKHANLMKNTQ